MLSAQYIAGFFDGEGSVGVYQNRARRGLGTPVINIAQAGERGLKLLTEIKDTLAAHNIGPCYIDRYMHKKSDNPQYKLRLCNRPGVMAFIVFVFPYLRIKKIEAQDVLRFMKVFGSIKGWYFTELNRLRSEAKARGEGYVAVAVPYNHPDSLGAEGKARVKYLKTHTPKYRHLEKVG